MKLEKLVNAKNRVLVRRYFYLREDKQPYFLFDTENCTLTLYKHTANGAVNFPLGKLIDREIFLNAHKPVVLFVVEKKRFIAMGDRVFQIDLPNIRITHYKGLIISQLTIIAGDEIIVARYVTPWWRIIFDDGMHPDLHFPLEYFSTNLNWG